jgi:drug/metabolite transporter (DMT)-like permease
MSAPARHVWAALLVVYVVWGSTYLAIKVVVETMPPLLSAGGRFLVAGTLLAAVLRLRGTSLRVTPPELAASAFVGLLLLALGNGMVHVAETRIDSSVAAMIVGTVPLQIVGLRILAGDDPARATRLSAVVGLVGLGLVVAPGLGDGSTALGLAVMVAAAVSWSVGSFLSGRVSLPGSPFVAAVYEMAAGGLFLVVGGAVLGELGQLDSQTFAADSIAAWVYLVFAGSLVGFSAYAWLLRVAPISLVVTHQYVNPLVAIALGMVLLGERPSPLTMAGALLVVGAVYAAVRAESPRRRRPASAVPRGTPADRTA